jgi:hypothetical protein
MKSRLLILAVLIGLMMGFTLSTGARQAVADELPCDPSPTMLRMCEIRGGTFNFVTCQCEFPE